MRQWPARAAHRRRPAAAARALAGEALVEQVADVVHEQRPRHRLAFVVGHVPAQEQPLLAGATRPRTAGSARPPARPPARPASARRPPRAAAAPPRPGTAAGERARGTRPPADRTRTAPAPCARAAPAGRARPPRRRVPRRSWLRAARAGQPLAPDSSRSSARASSPALAGASSGAMRASSRSSPSARRPPASALASSSSSAASTLAAARRGAQNSQYSSRAARSHSAAAPRSCASASRSIVSSGQLRSLPQRPRLRGARRARASRCDLEPVGQRGPGAAWEGSQQAGRAQPRQQIRRARPPRLLGARSVGGRHAAQQADQRAPDRRVAERPRAPQRERDRRRGEAPLRAGPGRSRPDAPARRSPPAPCRASSSEPISAATSSSSARSPPPSQQPHRSRRAPTRAAPRLEQRALEVAERGARAGRVVLGARRQLAVLGGERRERVKARGPPGERRAARLVGERHGHLRRRRPGRASRSRPAAAG